VSVCYRCGGEIGGADNEDSHTDTNRCLQRLQHARGDAEAEAMAKKNLAEMASADRDQIWALLSYEKLRRDEVTASLSQLATVLRAAAVRPQKPLTLPPKVGITLIQAEAVVRGARCPVCKRCHTVKDDGRLATHDRQPPLRWVCNGSGQPPLASGPEPRADAAFVVVRLRRMRERPAMFFATREAVVSTVAALLSVGLGRWPDEEETAASPGLTFYAKHLGMNGSSYVDLRGDASTEWIQSVIDDALEQLTPRVEQDVTDGG
jgi:hypothetical protein